MGNLFEELKRRNVFRVAVFYGVAAWLILQVGDLLFQLMGLPDWSLRIVLGILILGFPVVLIFSWVYEMTPEGLKREKDIDRSRSITPETGRKLDMVTIALLVAVGGLVLWQQFVFEPPVATNQPESAVDAGAVEVSKPASEGPGALTLAVLPFRNFSSDAENEYFVDGLSEELMNILAGIEPLRVAARTSSFSFKGKDVKVQEIGRELNVAHVLEGSVRKSGNKIRITAQLIQVSDGYHLWSDNFDRELDDVFAIQDEIAAKVADALRIELLGESEAPKFTPSAVAYDRYLAGRFHLRQLASGSAQRAAEEFQAAIDIDPDYAAAWAGLAESFSFLEEFGGMPLEEARRRQREALERAESLDPDLPEVLQSRATVQLGRGEVLEARDTLERAVAQKPNDTEILVRAAQVAGQLGEMRRHNELVVRSLELDPLSVDIRAHMTEVDLARGDIAMARQRVAELEAAHPADPVIHDYAYSVSFRDGRWAKAMRHLQRIHELRPEDMFPHWLLSIVWRNLGHTDYADRWLEMAQAAAPDSRYAALAEDFRMVRERRWAEREQFWKKRLEADPESRVAKGRLASTLTRLGRLDQAAELFEEILENSGYRKDGPAHFGIDFSLRWLAWIYQQQGRTEDAAVLVGQLDTFYRKLADQSEMSCLQLQEWAEVEMLKDEVESALEKLAAAVEQACYSPNYAATTVHYDAVRDSPEFAAVFAGVEGRIAEQRAIAEREGWGVPPEA